MNIDAARTEIKRVDTVLRSRYNYAHPVFNYLAAALKHLEGDLPEVISPPAEAPAEPEETVEQLEAEAEAAVVVEEEAEEAPVVPEAEQTSVEPKPPTRRARRRG